MLHLTEIVHHFVKYAYLRTLLSYKLFMAKPAEERLPLDDFAFSFREEQSHHMGSHRFRQEAVTSHGSITSRPL